MDQRDLARLLVKIASLVIMAYALIGLPQNMVTVIGLLSFGRATGTPSLGDALEMPQFWGMSFVPFAIYLAIGLGLFVGGGRIVDGFVPAVRSRPDGEGASPRALEEIAVFILGLYFFGQGLADMAPWLADVVSFLNRAQVSLVATPTMKVIIGIVLMFRCREVVKLRRRDSSRHD